MADWQIIIRPSLAAAASAAARDMASRLRNLELFETAIERVRQQVVTSEHYPDPACSCYTGHAGVALLCSELDHSFPSEGWDITGHQYLQAAIPSIRQSSRSPAHLGLFGSSGLLFITWSLSRGETRYRQTLATLEEQTFPAIRASAEKILADRVHGCADSLYDHISGLAGMGIYLLGRRHVPLAAQTLHAVLKALVYLTEESDGVPHWHTPAQLADSDWRRRFPNGYFNCGLAHGIAGPLALLSLAKSQGVDVPGLDEGIQRAVDWLVAHQQRNAWGIDWPIAFPVGCHPLENAHARTAWCYGIPGLARALWLAGKALDDSTYRDLALASMQGVYRRPAEARRLNPSGFCHGVAGLLQITLRFAHETEDAQFAEFANTFCEQLLASYDEKTLLGYQTVSWKGSQFDDPGLLEGVAGTILTLLAASTNHEPAWDRFFLLS